MTVTQANGRFCTPSELPGNSGEPCYTVYCLRRRITGRPYVGITKRSLKGRVAAHISQARRKRRIRSGGLLEAIREAFSQGKAFGTVFTVAALATVDDVERARALERTWIERLQARQPSGFNLMPGGASVGGPANAKPLIVNLPEQAQRSWPSIDAAIRACNNDRKASGLPLLKGSTVYLRLQSQWSVNEALGFVARIDKRSLRRVAIQIGGQDYQSLKQAAAVMPISVGALRSRLHRVRNKTSDIGTDRRHLPGKRESDLFIICPDTGVRLTPTSFAKRWALPKATVLYRWHQALRSGLDISDRGAFSAWLRSDQNRRKLVELVLPDGTVWTGGYRELIRRLLAHPLWEAHRWTRLGDSGIHRRLRRLSEADRSDVDRIRWAFGF